MKLLPAFLFSIFAAVLPAFALACVTAWPASDSAAIMARERALIIWNPVTKREDFIRSVDFETKSRNLGFIVPVPTVPEVADASEDIFEKLNIEMQQASPFDQERYDAMYAGSASAKVSDEVEVVASFKLAQYDVKVIKADSLLPLAQWLQDNKFAMRPDLKTWLQSYVDKKYYFTVFRFRKDDPDSNITSKAVRISFTAPQPYYPYQESADTLTDNDRDLELYFLSDAAYVPDDLPEAWGVNECLPKHRWLKKLSGENVAYPEFSSKIAPIDALRDLADFNKLDYLTVWMDKTKKRPARDLNFVKDNKFGKVLLCRDKD